MARGSDQAQTAATSAQGISTGAGANAASLYGQLVPELAAEAAHPAGIDPMTMARMDTAAQESGGGANATAVGQGALRSARTRNVGGADAAVAESARKASQTVSAGVLANRLRSAQLQTGERQSALGGLESLYGTNLGTSVNALGQVAANVNANTQAANASWDWAKYILDPAMAAAGEAAPTIAAAAKGCWIAEAIYGADDPRTDRARRYLNGDFRNWWFGRLVMWFYLRFGQSMAAIVRRSSLLRSILKPLFDVAAGRGVG